MSAADAPRPVPAWATKNGQVDLQRPVAATDAGPAIDRVLIAERIARYGWAYDEQDRERLGECFTEDAVWEGSLMGTEQIGPFVGRETIVEYQSGFWRELIDQRRHILTNVVVDELRENTAVAHAYLLLLVSRDAEMKAQTAGPYRLELVREAVDGVWRLKHLVGGWDAPYM